MLPLGFEVLPHGRGDGVHRRLDRHAAPSELCYYRVGPMVTLALDTEHTNDGDAAPSLSRRRWRSADVGGRLPARSPRRRSCPAALMEALARGGLPRRRTWTCSPWPSAPVRSPGCASASRRCRGWRVAARAAAHRRVGARGAGGVRRGRVRCRRRPLIAPWVDAWRGEVYAGAYRAGRALGPPVRRRSRAPARATSRARCCSSATAPRRTVRSSRRDWAIAAVSRATMTPRAGRRRSRGWRRRVPRAGERPGPARDRAALRAAPGRRAGPRCPPCRLSRSLLGGAVRAGATISTASCRSKKSRSPTRGRARCTPGSCRIREVCHIYVVRTPECRVAGFCAFWLVVDEVHVNNVALRPGLPGQGARHGADAARADRSPAAGRGPRDARGAGVQPGGAPVLRGDGLRGDRDAAALLHESGGRCADSLARTGREIRASSKRLEPAPALCYFAPGDPVARSPRERRVRP